MGIFCLFTFFWYNVVFTLLSISKITKTVKMAETNLLCKGGKGGWGGGGEEESGKVCVSCVNEIFHMITIPEY